MACEKCWRDAYLRHLCNPCKSQSEHYQELLQERKDSPCTPEQEQPAKCGYCHRPAEHDGVGGPKCTYCDDMLANC